MATELTAPEREAVIDLARRLENEPFAAANYYPLEAEYDAPILAKLVSLGMLSEHPGWRDKSNYLLLPPLIEAAKQIGQTEDSEMLTVDEVCTLVGWGVNADDPLKTFRNKKPKPRLVGNAASFSVWQRWLGQHHRRAFKQFPRDYSECIRRLKT